MNNNFLLYFWIATSVLFIVYFWIPRYGLLARWRLHREQEQRQQVEDAMKLIFNAPSENQVPNQRYLAEGLNLNTSKIRLLIERMKSQQLLTEENNILKLTLEGQQWALQVIRAHRLWERYLADEARMPLEKVHKAAHQKEHQLTVSEVNELAAALGHPIQDPHGDPIPNAAGKFQYRTTDSPLKDLQVGQKAKITHLEDEPELAYAQLLAEGLYVGQSVILQEKSPERIVLSGDDNLVTLAPSIANNVYIKLETSETPLDPAEIHLDNLASKELGEILRIDDRCQGFTRRRFLDLGLTPGTPIYPELENAFKEPRAYRVRGTLIALRHDQAEYIWVRRLPSRTIANENRGK